MASIFTRPRPQVVRAGAELIFETLYESDVPTAREREREDTLMRVVDGLVRLTVGGQERLMGAGDEAIVPAGETHRISSACQRALVIVGFRPATS
jgi:mannose-6-phosphate isomerase-like protein (cupin superfamily)